MARGIMTVEGDLPARELLSQMGVSSPDTMVPLLRRMLPMLCNACEEDLGEGKQKTTCNNCDQTFHMNCIADHECAADVEKVEPGVDSTAPAEAPQDVTATKEDKASTPAEAEASVS